MEDRFKKEAECFNTIATDRNRNNQIPDLRVDFKSINSILPGFK